MLRTIRPDEIDQAADLLAERGEPADGEDLRLVLADTDAGLSGTAVVVDGDRVVATASLLDEELDLCGHRIPTGQVELVATAASHEGRGLARALMEWCHQRSEARGHLAQIMIGIPNFYRRFGYSYTMPIPRVHVLTGSVEAPAGVSVRRATSDDIPVMAALQDDEQRTADLRMPHSDGCWRWLVARSGSEQWVAEHDGAVVGVGRALPEEGVLGELAATDPAGAVALLARAAELARDAGLPLYVQPRGRGRAHDAVAPYLDAGGRPDWYYARVPDLAALLEHLGPLLGARLRDNRAQLASWRRRRARGPAVDLHPAGALHGRTRRNHRDAARWPRAVTGEQGRLGAGRRGRPGTAPRTPRCAGAGGARPDCHLGRQRELMAALFPPVTADLLTFYLAV